MAAGQQGNWKSRLIMSYMLPSKDRLVCENRALRFSGWSFPLLPEVFLAYRLWFQRRNCKFPDSSAFVPRPSASLFQFSGDQNAGRRVPVENVRRANDAAGVERRNSVSQLMANFIDMR